MDVKDIKDWSNPESRFINFVCYLGQEIYYIESTLQVLKYKVCNMFVEIVNDKIFVEYECTPVAFWGGVSYEDIIVKYEDFNKSWFLVFSKAKQVSNNLKYKRKVSLF